MAAPVDVVWRSLTRQIAQQNITGSPALVRLLGAQPQRATGEPLQQGATVPGFAVDESVSEERVRLAGRHHFARYVLVFAMSAEPEGTVLAARSYAEFPGVLGFLYRQMVISSGAHPVAVRRMLHSVRRHAESHSAS